ncbi:MAG: hypothetical protein WCF84_05790 [Anaerolineae bacterium]
MAMTPATSAPPASGRPSHTFGEILRDATRYWEYRRIAYNLVLVALVVVFVVRTWPHFQPALNLQSLPPLLILAAIANILYCAAYLADLPLQLSTFGGAYRRWRWVFWLAGTLLALLVTEYWIGDEIYPYVK